MEIRIYKMRLHLSWHSTSLYKETAYTVESSTMFIFYGCCICQSVTSSNVHIWVLIYTAIILYFFGRWGRVGGEGGGKGGKRVLIISTNPFSIKLLNCLWNHVACHEKVVITAVAKAIISEELDPSPIIEPTRWKSSQISKLLITTILFVMKISWNFLNSESSSLDPNGCVLTQTAMAGTRLCCFAQFLCYA